MAARRSDFLTSYRTITDMIERATGGTLYVSSDAQRTEQLVEAARRASVSVRVVDRRELRRIAPEAHDVALELPSRGPGRATRLSDVLASLTAPDSLVVLLDHVLDPHNYGAILRSADQFGVDAVVVPGRGAAPLSGVTIQSSAGTAEHVTIVTVSNLSQAIAELQKAEFWVYAADMSGSPVHRTDMTGRTALILGSEGKGVSRLVLERADAAVSIPIAGHADSLNVSVACGVLLYEIRRQQGWFDAT